MKKFVFAVITALVSFAIGCMPVYAEDFIVGDVNSDGILNVRDAACIAHHLAENDISALDFETADYNADEIINVRDCASMAQDLAAESADKYRLTTINIPKKPDKSSCDVKSYINEMIEYKAYQSYGITNITIAEYIDPAELDTLSWDTPVQFIANDSDYLVLDMPMLPAAYQSDCESVIDSLMLRIESMIEEQETDYADKGFSDDEMDGYLGEKNSFTIYWQSYNSKGNYQIYVIM